MKTRGVIQIAVALWIVGGLLCTGIAYEAAKVFSPGRNTKTADKLATATANTQAQAKAVDAQANAVKLAVADVEARHAVVEQTQAAMASNATGLISGSTAALQSDPRPTQAETIALGLNDAASKALGSTLTPAQAALWNKLVAGLLANNAEAWSEVNTLKAQGQLTAGILAATQQHAAQSDAHATQLAAELTTQTKTLTATASTAAKLGALNKSWADDALTLWQRIVALGWLAVLLAVLLLGLAIRFLGLQKTLQDTVALGEYMKGEAVKAGHDVMQWEQKIAAWWAGDKGEKVVAKIKENVLRL
jgi:hypothetical protein